MPDYFDEAVQGIRESVGFNSALAKHSKKYPFGKGVADCLEHFLKLAASLGFETHNYQNFAGDVIFGEGEEFAVLCHLDTVPMGDGWTQRPFKGEITDGKLWGRGTMDDKGPAICCLYALKRLKDEGFVPHKKIKLIVGCNEENGWACIEHYAQVTTLPETGISPDAEFPVIYAEKGILQLRLHFPVDGEAPFVQLDGGKQGNMVCAHCEATPREPDPDRAEKAGLKTYGRRIVSFGKSAHGSTPELGENAILPMLRYFADECPAAKRVIECVFDDVYGLGKLEDETGKLTMSPNIIRYRSDQLQVIVDIRYPATLSAERVLSIVKKFGVPYETIHAQKPLLTDKDSELVQTLLSVYESCTGQKAEPIAIGGGTYARALKHGVGFGPEMPGDVSCIHMADEYISLDRIRLLLDIYTEAIRRLTK